MTLGLVVAIDDFGGEQPPLPFARQEAKAIAARLPVATVLASTQATPDSLRAQLAAHSEAPFTVRHFTTHAVFEAGCGRLSRLVLSDSEQLADEIETMHIPARLVTLAACEVALGVVHSGDEVIGLSRAFIGAGAQRVLSALWSVADDDSPCLIDDFYAAFATDNQPAPAAIADTQRRWIKAGRPASTWAAYSMFGPP